MQRLIGRKPFLRLISSVRALTVVGVSIVGGGLGLAGAILIGRGFGPQDYGLFATLVPTFALLVPLLTLGLDRLLLRYAAKGAWSIVNQIVGWIVVFIPLMCLALLPVLAVIASAVYEVPVALMALAGFWLFAIALHPAAMAVFQIQRRDVVVAFWSVLPSLGRLMAVGVALLLGSSFAVFLGLFALAGLLLGLASLWILLSHRPRFASYGDSEQRFATGDGLWERGLEGFPFAVSAVLFLIYYQIDVIMLSAMIDTKAAGFYSVAMLFVAAVYLPQRAFFQRFLLARIFVWWEQPGRLTSRLRQALAGVFVYAAAASGVLIAGAEHGVILVFGDDYRAAVAVLAALACAVPFRLLAGTLSAFLVTPVGLRKKVRAQAAVAFLNIVLNLLWIPQFGVTGAVLATVVSEAVLLILYGAAMRSALREVGHASGVTELAVKREQAF